MDTIGQVIRMDNMREGYVAVVKAVAEFGEKVAPRGQMTRELQCATLIVENPYDTLPTGVGRALVPGIAAVESAQLLAGRSLPELMIAIAPTFRNFTEDNGLFHGAYGPRTALYDQFETIIERLKADPSSRQTVVSIWNPAFDMMDGKRDYPCTLLYHFMIRNDKLHMEVVMRSNDVILGLGYDAFQHSRVQIAVASVLGVELGEYRHHAMSLHLYERDLDKVALLTMPQQEPEFFPAITGSTWQEVREAANLVLDLAQRNDGTAIDVDTTSSNVESLQWYVNSMIKAIEKNKVAT